MMNPETNKFEMLRELEQRKEPENQDPQTMNRAERRRYLKSLNAHQLTQLVRPDGSAVPPHWPVFKTGELIDIKDYTFRVAHIGESYLLLEPVRPTDALKGVVEDTER